MIDAEELKWLGETPRIAAYRVGANGRSAAEIGLARALARNASPVQTIGAIPAADLTKSMTAAQRGAVATALARQGVAPAKPKASTSQPHDRVKFVAAALERDPALKGKHGDALAMLADPDFAGLTGAAVVKSLKAGITVSRPVSVASKANASHPARAAAPAPKDASIAMWDKAIANMGRSAPSLGAVDPVWEKAIAKLRVPV